MYTHIWKSLFRHYKKMTFMATLPCCTALLLENHISVWLSAVTDAPPFTSTVVHSRCNSATWCKARQLQVKDSRLTLSGTAWHWCVSVYGAFAWASRSDSLQYPCFLGAASIRRYYTAFPYTGSCLFWCILKTPWNRYCQAVSRWGSLRSICCRIHPLTCCWLNYHALTVDNGVYV